MRRNLVLLTIVWALVLMLSASCATKNGVIITAPGWLGPNITAVTVAPAAPYYMGGDVTITVTAAATNGGTLTYAWTLNGTWGTITAGADTAEITVHLDAVAAASGKVVVTETVDTEAKTDEQTFSFDVLAPLNAVPVVNLTAAGNALTAALSDADGDDLTVTWTTTAGTVTPGTASNTEATATFNPPAGEGTATITCTANDGIADGSDSVDIDYAFNPFDGIAEDTIFLFAPNDSVATGSWTYVFIGANIATAKPLANLNAVRLLVANSQLLATDLGCMTQSETNFLFSNTFASGMAADATSGGDALYTAYSQYDAWAGFGDQTGVALLSAPALPQATFVDTGVNWGNNTMTKTGTGFVCVVKMRGTGAGAATVDIQGRDSEDKMRTFYSDLDKNNYEFANIEPGITINVG